MAGRHGGRGHIPEDGNSPGNSLESIASSMSPAARNSRPHHPTVAYYRSHGRSRPGFVDDEEWEQEHARSRPGFVDDEEWEQEHARSRPGFVDDEEWEQEHARSRPGFVDDEEWEQEHARSRPGFVDDEEWEQQHRRSRPGFVDDEEWEQQHPRSRPGFVDDEEWEQQHRRSRPGFVDDEEWEQEQDYKFRAGASNDNPLYEVEEEENRLPDPSASRQGQASPNYNPLYGNDPFKPTISAAVCMTGFLKPKPGSPQSSGYCSPGYSLVKGQSNSRQATSGSPQGSHQSPGYSPDYSFYERQSNPRQSNIKKSTDEDDAPTSRRRRTPERSPPLRRAVGKGLFQATQGDQPIVSYPPARFSPVLPSSRLDSDTNPIDSSPKGKRLKQTPALPIPQSQSAAPNIGDLIAAVRSDKNLLLGEVRKQANREPRVPGDHDRYFYPRTGDIIIHFTPTLDDNKLLEYYDGQKSMLRLQPGDKLVRVKYDNFKLPDHLMITSKLYLYAPEWVYLGKALQTIKTA